MSKELHIFAASVKMVNKPIDFHLVSVVVWAFHNSVFTWRSEHFIFIKYWGVKG